MPPIGIWTLIVDVSTTGPPHAFDVPFFAADEDDSPPEGMLGRFRIGPYQSILTNFDVLFPSFPDFITRSQSDSQENDRNEECLGAREEGFEHGIGLDSFNGNSLCCRKL